MAEETWSIRDLLSEALRLQEHEEETGFAGPNPALWHLTTAVDVEALFEQARFLRDGTVDERQLYARLVLDATIPAERRLADVMQALSDESDPKVMRWLVFGLRNAASNAAIAKLRELARHPSPKVRSAVPDGLSACADRFDEVAELLLKLSRDPDTDVRWSAVYELGAWWNESKDPRIEARLSELRVDDPSEEVRRVARDGLEPLE